MWWFTNLSEIGRSRYFVQPLGLNYILGYDENRIFLTFLKPILLALEIYDFLDFLFCSNEMHMPLGDCNVITGPSMLLWGLA